VSLLAPVVDGGSDLFILWFAAEVRCGKRGAKDTLPLPTSTLHKILRNRIYTGEFNYAGRIYQGIREPLVTRAIWEQVQGILDGRYEKKHRKVTYDFAFSGLVSCDHCGCSLVGEVKNGCRGKCAEPYTREEILEGQFAEGLHELVIPRPILDWLHEEFVASDVSEHAAREQTVRRDQSELIRLQNRLDALDGNRLDGRIDAGTYDKKAGERRQQQDRMRRRLAEAQSIALLPVSQAVDLIALTAKAADLFLKQSVAEQRKLLRLVLEAATWKGGESRMPFREAFAQFQLSNRATHTNNMDLAASRSDFEIWRRKRDSNPRTSYPVNGFQDRRLQPLGHSSVFYLTLLNRSCWASRATAAPTGPPNPEALIRSSAKCAPPCPRSHRRRASRVGAKLFYGCIFLGCG
jgi:site-specific DNA recombinase